MADPHSRTGSTYLDSAILEFVQKVHAAHDEWLARAFAAPEAHGMPAIQVGPSAGKLIGTLLRLIQAGKVVEVGTLAGYSALWIARALREDGHLWTVEADPKHADVAQANIKAAGLQDKVTVVEGPALGVLGILERHGPFDAVFVDADKENYPAYGRWAADNLREGGLLLADNAFYFGGLMEDSSGAAAMRRFHQEAASAFETVCIPTPDGLLLGLKR